MNFITNKLTKYNSNELIKLFSDHIEVPSSNDVILIKKNYFEKDITYKPKKLNEYNKCDCLAESSCSEDCRNFLSYDECGTNCSSDNCTNNQI